MVILRIYKINFGSTTLPYFKRINAIKLSVRVSVLRIYAHILAVAYLK